MMPASEEYFRELREELMRADTEEQHNALLDEWYDAEYRATDYDAVQWGFDPERWGQVEFKQMDAKAARRNRSTKASKES